MFLRSQSLVYHLGSCKICVPAYVVGTSRGYFYLNVVFLSTFMYPKLSQVKTGILEALLFHPVVCTQRATQVPRTVIVNSPIRDHRPKL